MKVVSRILSLLVLTSATLFFANCGGGGGDEDPAEKVQLGKLSKTWNIVSASLDGVDRTSDFTSLALTISGTYTEGGIYNYSFTGSRPNPSPWPVSGTWKFASPTNVNSLIRLDDDLPIAITTLTDTQLTLSFTCTTCDFAGSRVNQVNGNWVFNFD